MKCISANDLLCGLGINTSNNCDLNVCRVNAVLRKHYANLVGTHISRGSIGFTGSGEQQLSTSNGEEIYKLLAIYVELKPCDAKTNCHKEVKKCDGCATQWYTIPPKRALFDDSDLGSYSVDGDNIYLNVGPGVIKGYLEYARGPKEITNMKDNICIDPLEMEILQMSMLRSAAEIDKDYKLAEYYEQREFNARNRIQTQIENRIPDSIGSGYIPK